MDRDAVVLFLSLLAVGAQAFVVLALASAIGGRRTATTRRWLVDVVGASARSLTLVVVAVATAGSLYLSEVAHFTPCTLCWYQRIAMYPMVLLLVVATVRDDDVSPYAIGLSSIGGATSIYHMLVERFPTLETDACDPANPCSLIWTERLGYLTIPTMALSAFALVVTLSLLGRAFSRAVAAERPTDVQHHSIPSPLPTVDRPPTPTAP
jgi:disulfide bond formation protein DsbB